MNHSNSSSIGTTKQNNLMDEENKPAQTGAGGAQDPTILDSNVQFNRV